jgi:hypothetical protein
VKLSKLIAGVTLATAASAASAIPLTGQFSILGQVNTSNPNLIDFNPQLVAVPTDTAFGNVQTLLATAGTSNCFFLTCFNTLGTITDVNLLSTPQSIPNFLVFNLPGGSLTLGLTSWTASSNTALSGTGTLSSTVAGYESAPTAFSMTTQGSGLVTFSATVPAPGVAALLGVGLLGLGLARRRIAA